MTGAATAVALSRTSFGAEEPHKGKRPNIILMMADDMGWVDAGYMGNKLVRTPHLDAMAEAGLRFNRFYAASPVCSPTRGSCLTGRHPYRYGVFHANVGHLPPQEVTLAELLRSQGYTTGHFGKWHLGTLTRTQKDSNRGGPRGAKHYSPPWDNGFDHCFSTEAKVPTFNPMRKPGSDEPYGTAYWKTGGVRARENLEGDDSRVIMDRVMPFIREAVRREKPFLAVVWFHSPHLPAVAGAKYLKMYANLEEKKRHYFGCITAMDTQIGRLRKELRASGVAENTMLWFCSDNGPEGKAGRAPGSGGPLRGRKRSLFEGGIRVPGLLEWRAKVKPGSVTDVPACTSDYLPTILDAVGTDMPDARPLDGVSLLPLIEAYMRRRPRPIAFESGKQLALIDNRYKLISPDSGRTWMLFDLVADLTETHDIADHHPDIVRRMRAMLDAWRKSCEHSLAANDYRKTPE